MHSLCWDLSAPKHMVIWLSQQQGLISISGNAQGSREEGPAEPAGGGRCSQAGVIQRDGPHLRQLPTAQQPAGVAQEGSEVSSFKLEAETNCWGNCGETGWGEVRCLERQTRIPRERRLL